MNQNFEKSLKHILAYEGGWSNDPDDPGGATMRGVTQRVYDGYRRRAGLATRSVRNISDAELRAIYRQQYWDACKAPALPAGIDFVVFDGAVNSGVGQSIKWLQRGLKAAGLYHGPIDGDCGLGTLAAVASHRDHDLLIADILARRLGMLRELKTWWKYGGGWEKRVVKTMDIGQAWATGSVGPAPVAGLLGDGGTAKGYAGDVATATIPVAAGTNTAAAGTGLAATVQTVSQAIQPYTDLSPYVAYAFIGLTIAGAAIAIGGAVSAFISSRQNARAQAAIDGELVADLAAVGA